ncbi:apoptosis-resistant E3 ubiquitin protein ligase 1-like [Halichondria panicea]|uniref:apoptosis-resistant E3 ubiquitin protein ligase 1-like n=1 Tax=Halichondria panicea TaxID=6063 RepID=UPI00312B321B
MVSSLSCLLKLLSEYRFKEYHQIPIRRTHVLVDALRAARRPAFTSIKTLTVHFVSEEAEDGGGPSREFWCLLGKEIAQSMFEGHENSKVVRHDLLALQGETFLLVGKLMTMGITQGDSGFSFFGSSLYAYLCGVKICDIDIPDEEVPNTNVRILIQKINDAADDKDLKDCILDECDTIVNAGYSKPLFTSTQADKVEIVKTLKLYYTLLESLAEINQLKEGLQVNGVGEAIVKYPELMRPLFVHNNTQVLTAETMKAMFKITHFSPKGSNDLAKEEATYMLFVDFLYDCECVEGDSEDSVSLKTILSFTTGSESVPPIGFDNSLGLRFNDTNVFPTSSTCALELTLPSKYYNNPEEFKKKMVYGMKNHGGFGCL